MPASRPLRPRFQPVSDLHREIRRRATDHFASCGIARHGSWRFFAKAGFILVWWLAAWALLVFWAENWATALPLAVLLGLAMCGIGFNIQHDGGHRACSDRPAVNRLMAFGLDLMGGSSYVWNWKHNHLHHQFTNVDGLDDDLSGTRLIRMAPTQPWRPYHRFQVLYVWGLYALLGVKWQWWDDFANMIRGRIGTQPIPRPRGRELVALVGGKAFTYGWTLAIPLVVRAEPFWVIGLVYLVTLGTVGVVLATVFQLAHVTEEAGFACTRDDPRIGRAWADHQIGSTCNFSPHSRWITAYVGGLNFQIEHHLFPQVGHEHYPALARIVRGVCEERGVRYACHESILGAFGSHLRWLRRMGVRPEPGGPMGWPRCRSSRS